MVDPLHISTKVFTILCVFACGLCFISQVETFLVHYITDTTMRYLVMHIPCILIMNTMIGFIWSVLTIAHGLAHIYYPAFRGTIYNTDYTPLYDYMIHGLQCFTGYWYSPRLLYPSLIFGINMFIAGIVAHVSPSFLETGLWVLMSIGGAYGTQFHMLLLDDGYYGKRTILQEKNIKYAIFIAMFMIWFGSYTGYIFMEYIPVYDNFMNNIYLFKYWYLNTLLTKFIMTKVFSF